MGCGASSSSSKYKLDEVATPKPKSVDVRPTSDVSPNASERSTSAGDHDTAEPLRFAAEPSLGSAGPPPASAAAVEALAEAPRGSAPAPRGPDVPVQHGERRSHGSLKSSGRRWGAGGVSGGAPPPVDLAAKDLRMATPSLTVDDQLARSELNGLVVARPTPALAALIESIEPPPEYSLYEAPEEPELPAWAARLSDSPARAATPGLGVFSAEESAEGAAAAAAEAHPAAGAEEEATEPAGSPQRKFEKRPAPPPPPPLPAKFGGAQASFKAAALAKGLGVAPQKEDFPWDPVERTMDGVQAAEDAPPPPPPAPKGPPQLRKAAEVLGPPEAGAPEAPSPTAEQQPAAGKPKKKAKKPAANGASGGGGGAMVPPPLRPASQALQPPPRDADPPPAAEDASFFGFSTRPPKLPTISEDVREVDSSTGDAELPEAFHHPELRRVAAQEPQPPAVKLPPAPQPKGKPKLRKASDTMAAAASSAEGEVEEPEFKLPPPPPVPKSKPKLRPAAEEAPAPAPDVPVSPDRAARRAKFAEEVNETVVIPSRWEAPGTKLTGSHARAQEKAAAVGSGEEPSWAGLAAPAQGDLEVVKVQKAPTNRFRMSDTPADDGLPAELRSSLEWRPGGAKAAGGGGQPAVPEVEGSRPERAKVAPRIAPGSSTVRPRARGSYRAETDASTTASSSDAIVV